ncbi:MAG: hypothetical protein FWE56_01190 [Candidatus Bathyarchaeota archaeon]|nr:hypothetical protein [Candidatus Termiticorpusculum sp.]
MKMKKVAVLALVSLLFGLSFFALFTPVYAEQIVGVKEGDWMEYDITVTGAGSLPPSHDVRWMRIEILSVDGVMFPVNVTVRYANGTLGSAIWTYNFTEGLTGGWTIIPANLDPGDTFFDCSPFATVTVHCEEQRTVLGATRVVTSGSDELRQIKEWDKATGVFIGSVETKQDFTNKDGWYFDNLTMTIRATGTNMWNRQILGFEQSVFALVISSLVFVVVLSVSALCIWQKKKLINLSLRYPILTKKSIPAVIIIGVVVFAYIVIPAFWMNRGLSDAEVNMIMQSVWMSLILASISFRKSGNNFIHGFLMTAVVIATLISFASVLFMWTPSDSANTVAVYFSSTTKLAEFIAHGIFSIPALAFGVWFVALWRPNSTTFPVRSRRIVKLLLIMWGLSYLVGVLGYIVDYTTLLGIIY